MIFPEGARSTSGELAPLPAGHRHSGEAEPYRRAARGLRGVGEMKVRGRGWFRSGEIEIHVGEPIRFAPQATEAEITHACTMRLRSCSGKTISLICGPFHTGRDMQVLGSNLYSKRRGGDTFKMTKLDQPALEELMNLARGIAQHAYAPYSQFRVGAALKLSNGEIVTGDQCGKRQLRADHLRRALGIGAGGFAIRAGDSHRGRGRGQFERRGQPALRRLPAGAGGVCVPDAPVMFPAADGVRTMPFSELLPLAFEMKLK